MFKFAIITDTHIRSPGGDLSSPFPVNEKANGRARHAVALVEKLAPDFTIHLGDMVHPLPHMEAYSDAVREAHEIFSPLKPALHFVPGNHDIGDKPAPAMPAKPLSGDSEQRYQSAFGPAHYQFEQQGMVFIVLNSSLINSATDAETLQAQWLEEALASAAGKRLFLFSHYPPFITSPDEISHYDNYAQPGRNWLLELAVQHKVEAIFSGHVHQFFYNVYQGVKLICLPPTSFIRQDYAELYATSPAAEYGRDDVHKYSVCQITVNTQDFEIEVIPTLGRELHAATDKPVVTTDKKNTLALVPHLRHAWFEARHLPYNGPMEEFGRKLARNDYPLLRLLQLGIDTVRIPVSDLQHPEALRRVQDWISIGRKFVFFNVGEPDDDHLKLLQAVGDGLAGFEQVCVDGIAEEVNAAAIDRLQLALHCPLLLSKISTSANNADPTMPYAHSVSSGFDPLSVEQVLAELDGSKIDTELSIVFQLPWGQAPAPAIQQLADRVLSAGYGLVVNIRLANSNPAIENFDDNAIATTLREAIDSVDSLGRVSLQCDTFEDVDRGYHPRHGLIDRQGNIRSAIASQLMNR